MSKYAAQQKYDKINTVIKTLKLNIVTDKDIIEKLDSLGKGKVQGYIKKIIKEDLKNENVSTRI